MMIIYYMPVLHENCCVFQISSGNSAFEKVHLFSENSYPFMMETLMDYFIIKKIPKSNCKIWPLDNMKKENWLKKHLGKFCGEGGSKSIDP